MSHIGDKRLGTMSQFSSAKYCDHNLLSLQNNMGNIDDNMGE